MKQDRDRATGKELPQVLDTEGPAAGYSFLLAWGALTGNLEQLGQLHAQLLHGNVCDGAQDDHWPLEAGCREKTDRLREAAGKGRARGIQPRSSRCPWAWDSPCSSQESRAH